MPYPVPNYWIVSGTLNKNGIPFYEGKVYADNLKNGVFQTIAETGISSDGSFTLGFSSSQFQNGDTTLEYPTLRIRVEDYQQNTLWTSGIYNEPDSALNIGAVDILNYQGGDCRVFGTVKNNQGNVLSGLKINAYCLHFEETVSSNSTTRRFRKIVLGTVDTDPDGRYEIRYSSSMLPTGLHLDSKEDYGKDKVSLYAEVFEQGDTETYKSLAIEHLVFNGKSEQEINFTLKSQQKVFRCEFEKIEQSLAVYYDAVFAEYDGSDITKKISAIGKFLKSNTTFPLVTGRERIADSKAQAYFMAYSLFLQLQKRLANDPKADEFLSPEPPKKWPEVFFALALREGVSTLVRLKSIKPTVIQKTLFGAVSDGLICPVDTTYILELWKKLVNGNMLQGEDGEADDSLTISQLISLYIKGNLTIEFPSEGQSQDGEEAAGRRPHYVAVEDFAEETANEGTGTDNGPSLDGDGQEEDGQEEIQEPSKSDDQVLYEELLEAYYNVGADTGALIEWLQEAETPHLTQAEISRLKAVFDLNDFFEKFAPGVVCAYRYAIQKENFEFGRLADLIYLDDSDWKSIVDEIAKDYYTLYRYEGTVPTNGDGQLSSALPPEFPGSNVNLKKIIYARKLSEQIIAWFPQQALLWGLKDRLEDQEWGDTCDLLMSPAWEDFSLSDTDLDEYIGDSTVSAKEKIQQLQRLYHLTESAEAIAYLINHGFKSAYQISTMSENEFVAKHGNGIGKVAEARQIHRLAQNYMAEASLNIQAYVTSSVEEPAEEPEEEYPVPENRDGQQNVTLRAIPRALPKTRMLRATDPELNTNTARFARLHAIPLTGLAYSGTSTSRRRPRGNLYSVRLHTMLTY